jgi:hypothetical protein
VRKIAIAMAGLAVLVLTGCSGILEATPTPTPVPTPTVDWPAVERAIEREADGVVLGAEYDPSDDFLTVTVADATTAEVAELLSCETILPALDAVESFALFAVYSESGEILASWNRCLPVPSPSPSASSAPPSP